MVEKLSLLLKKFYSQKIASRQRGSNHVPIAQDSTSLTSVPPFLMFKIQLFKLKNQFTKHFNIFVKDV